MGKEGCSQFNLFTGELVDNRTKAQKRKAKERENPQQAEMFSQRELAQFGAKARPQLPISPKTRIELAMEDRRTEEEREKDLRREIAQNTYPIPGIGEGIADEM